MANKGRKVGLLRGAGTRMALWFYAMMRLLRLKQPLRATIHQQKFVALNLNDTVASAVQDIEDNDFWKCLYVILRAVFPALRLLRYCDKSKPAMDKIYYLSYRTTQALEQSEKWLNDENLFGSIRSDRNLARAAEIIGGEVDDEAEDDGVGTVTFANLDSDDNDGDADDDGSAADISNNSNKMSFGRQFIWNWDKRKNHIEHEYAIVGWSLCVMESVRKDVAARLTGTHRDAIAEVVRRLHCAPCPNTNPAIARMTLPEIIDTYWNEFKSFQQQSYPFAEPSRWATADVTQGNSFLWHEKYSLPYTVVLGFVACRTTAKLCGIGAAERSWGGVKQIKTGKRSHMSGESTEKRSILYVSAKIAQSRVQCDRLEKLDATGNNAMFGDDDINFDMQLEQFGVDMGALKEPAVERIFRAWVEDWEEESRKKNDCVDEARLLQKYKGLVFFDPDSEKTFSVWDQNMEFRRGRGMGWFVVAVSADEPDDENNEAFSLEIACELIGVTKQKEGVQVLRQEVEE